MGQGPTDSSHAALHWAKMLWMYGGADGVRILSRAELVRITSAKDSAIRQNQRGWKDELELTLQNRPENPWKSELSTGAVGQHQTDTEFVRKQMDETKAEVDSLATQSEHLLEMLERIADRLNFQPEDANTVIELVSSALRTKEAKRKHTSHFLALQKRWQEMSGLDAVISANKTAANETSRAKAKAKFTEGFSGAAGAAKASVKRLAEGTVDVFAD